MAFKKVKSISEYSPGEVVNDLFVVRFKKPVKTARNGNFFFQLKIQDSLGDSMLTFFGGADRLPVQELYDRIETDQVVRVTNGKADIWDKGISFSVDSKGGLEPLEAGQFSVEDFVRNTKKDAEEMADDLKRMIAEIKDEELRALLNSFFGDEEFMKKFLKAPGAMYNHHGWVCGLLEHTHTVAIVARAYADMRPELDKDLVTAGALLHDIGKVKELEMTTTIKVSKLGNLLGHIVLGLQMATKRFEGVNASDELKNKLYHMMVSHHGETEYGSPKVPAFPEAMAVYHADAMDALTANMADLRETAETGDLFRYDKKLGNIYLK